MAPRLKGQRGRGRLWQLFAPPLGDAPRGQSRCETAPPVFAAFGYLHRRATPDPAPTRRRSFALGCSALLQTMASSFRRCLSMTATPSSTMTGRSMFLQRLGSASISASSLSIAFANRTVAGAPARKRRRAAYQSADCLLFDGATADAFAALGFTLDAEIAFLEHAQRHGSAWRSACRLDLRMRLIRQNPLISSCGIRARNAPDI